MNTVLAMSKKARNKINNVQDVRLLENGAWLRCASIRNRAIGCSDIEGVHITGVHCRVP